MKKLLFWLAVFGAMVSRPVMAVSLEESSIRLARMQTGSSPLPILVTIKTNSLVTENGFRLIVGNGWQVGGTWTITTADLPTGVYPWPSLEVANISGKTVDFDSGDLTVNTSYGFYITSGVMANPVAGDGDNYKWRLATLVGGIIDNERELKVPVLGSDTVMISGTVMPKAYDYAVSIVSNSNGAVSQNQEIGYTISFSSFSRTITRPLILTATWERGVVDSQPGLEVDVVDYKIGSATLGYGGVVPVIDLLNRKITWTMTSFPTELENQTVSFSLVTNESFTSSEAVSFGVSASINAANLLSISSNRINEQYRYFSITTPTPIPSLVPTAIISLTPTPTVISVATTSTTVSTVTTPTPTPTIVSVPLRMTSVDITNLASEAIKMELTFNKNPSNLKIKYGSSLTKLNKTVAVLDPKSQIMVSIDGLKPETAYYFRVVADTFESDYFTFMTPSLNVIENEVKEAKITVISKDTILSSTEGGNELNEKVVVIPVDQPYSVMVEIGKTKMIKNAKLWIRNKNVLGIVSATDNEANIKVSDLFEVENGKLYAYFMSPNAPGWYEFYLRVYDFYGGVREEKVAVMRVVNELKIINSKGEGIERATVTLYRLNQATKIYELLPGTKILENPIYSESDGVVSLVLPKGGYKAEIGAIGYANKEVNFVVDSQSAEVYPKVSMISEKMTLGMLTRFYTTVIKDVTIFMGKVVNELSLSYRFFNLLSVVMVFFLLVVTWWSFSHKLQVNWWIMPIFLLYQLKRQKKSEEMISGRIINTDGMSVSRAKIYLIEAEKNEIVGKIESNIFGRFFMKVPKGDKFKISVMAKGFDPSPLLDYYKEGLMAGNLSIVLDKSAETEVLEKVGDRIGKLFGRFFEVLLSLSFIVELAIGFRVGWIKIIPMFVLSLFNYWLWLKIENES